VVSPNNLLQSVQNVFPDVVQVCLRHGALIQPTRKTQNHSIPILFDAVGILVTRTQFSLLHNRNITDVEHHLQDDSQNRKIIIQLLMRHGVIPDEQFATLLKNCEQRKVQKQLVDEYTALVHAEQKKQKEDALATEVFLKTDMKKHLQEPALLDLIYEYEGSQLPVRLQNIRTAPPALEAPKSRFAQWFK
jgi:hypothetical protein